MPFILLFACLSMAYTGADLINRPANSWVAFPLTQMQRVVPSASDYPNIYAVEGPSCVIDCWCGGVFDSKRNRLVVWGGGHNGYFGNEIYVFDIDSLKWTRFTEPSANPNLCGQTNSDGTPNGRHTYGGLAYISHADRFFGCGGAPACPGGGCGMNITWTFDFTSKRWTNRSPSGTGPGTWCEDNCAYDSVTKKVYYFDGRLGFYSYDYDANRWTELNSSITRYNYASVVDPKRRLLLNIGHGEVWAYDLNSATPAGVLWNTTGGSMFIAKGAMGLAYDSKSDRIVGWHGGDVYTLNCDTKAWTAYTAANAPAPNANGTYGRWQYVPRYNAFICVNRIGDNVYFYKLTAGNGSAVEKKGPEAADVEGACIVVTDVRGKVVARLKGGKKVSWNGRSAAQGVYVLQWIGDGRVLANKKIVVIR